MRTLIRRIGVGIALLTAIAELVTGPVALAQSAVGDGSAFVPNQRPVLRIGRASGTIEIDGDLDDAGWRGVEHVKNFSEEYPGDQTRPPVETEAMLTYDDRNLYVAFIAHDDPSAIRATLHDRDEMWNEDMCGLIVDTYGDAAWAYEIFVNALGVQGDILWSSSSGEDTRFDMIYTSRTRITPDGYQIEMAIPFSSLRFPDRPSQTWKGTFWRIHPRDSRREYSWATISRDDPCSFCQYGTITGIENVRPGGALELLPSVVAFQSGALADPGNPDTAFNDSKVKGRFSLGARYAFSPSVVADLTYNPDFSQVESDAAKVNVNNTFAISYPEHRPFFQEGSDLFNTRLSAVYTRSINDPLAAAKLTGRLGSNSIAYIGAYDRNSPVILPFEERSIFLAGGGSTSNILRATHAFPDNSYVGALLTDRRFDNGGSGTTFGFDGQFRLSDIYRLDLEALASHTAEPSDTALGPATDLRFGDGKHTASFDGEEFWGTGLCARLQRDGRSWNFNINYWDRSPGFRTDNGFTTRNDMRQIAIWNGLNLYPDIGWIDKVVPNIEVGRTWNYDGIGKEMWASPAIELNLKSQTWVKLSYPFGRERFEGIEFPGISHFVMNVTSDFSSMISTGFDLTVGHSIARTLDTPVMGHGTDFSIWATIKPLDRFNIQPSLDFSDLHYPDGSLIYSGYIVRAKLNFQFTRELFLRMVVQYDNFGRAFAVEPLLTYKLSPFTIFYVGSSHDFTEFSDPSHYAATSRQFFAKFQYLVQM